MCKCQKLERQRLKLTWQQANLASILISARRPRGHQSKPQESTDTGHTIHVAYKVRHILEVILDPT